MNGAVISSLFLRPRPCARGISRTFLKTTEPSVRFTSCTSQPASSQPLECELEGELLHHVSLRYASMGRLVPINPSIRANPSLTTLVNAARNFKCFVSPSYFETIRGETTRRAQCRQSIAVGSPVATSGTMQSRQNKRLQRSHFLRR